MAVRVTYVRKHSYNTKSNGIRIVKTAGGKMTVQHRQKISNGVRCGDCGCVLAGIRHIRPHQYGWLGKSKRTVTRAYGGVRCHKCVQKKILRAFLINEHNLIKLAAAKSNLENKQNVKEDKKKATKTIKKADKKNQKK
ncbi:60S ribosomal protein L34-A, putative [Entamoeba dispar SAW760]|uniref:60S ribosomal protein L34-A, putative n=1 Tax=Entamoeba dispar (strain ATCC PRA-260 / SAW760) TaxID=370354 RepID=B0E7J4_ENTDS|nr:60S ribosomal protein L34-A, putative [Entamoeba dispar SAW760]EDR29496.1 60S ribosomal protein L34-A, putative [Entamoeba dispar SAW760]|eukprot:EDR29496.1 60S ribosomal protein L34-A, putative [Entamoeba dispar SAW760]